MKKRYARSATIKEQTSKSSMHNHASRSRRLIQNQSTNHNCNPFQNNPTNHYQLMKRTRQRLRAIGGEEIRLVTDMRFSQNYFSRNARLWLQDAKTEHIYRASIREIALLGKDKINPFDNFPIDMDQYGSVGAVMEHVHGLSFGNIEFTENNELGEVDDLYEFLCNIHRYRFMTPFSKFLADPMSACATCQFHK